MTFFEAAYTLPFMQNAFIMGLLASVACGVIGSYVVVKRLVFLSGGVSHSVLAGLGAAYYFGGNPLFGAIVSAVLAALLIGWIRLRARQREDTLIGALWAIGMAIGLVFIHSTPEYTTDLMSYLFGNILMVTTTDLWIIAALDALILGLVALFYKPFLAVCFDEEYARLQGLRVEALYLLLLCLIALTVVVLIQAVGVILVIALLTLPAAIGSILARTLWGTMLIASLLGMIFTSGGIAASYQYDLPSGAAIILLAGAVYILAVGVRAIQLRRRVGTSV